MSSMPASICRDYQTTYQGYSLIHSWPTLGIPLNINLIINHHDLLLGLSIWAFCSAHNT
jgi:hypothetical protein